MRNAKLNRKAARAGAVFDYKLELFPKTLVFEVVTHILKLRSKCVMHDVMPLAINPSNPIHVIRIVFENFHPPRLASLLEIIDFFRAKFVR